MNSSCNRMFAEFSNRYTMEKLKKKNLSMFGNQKGGRKLTPCDYSELLQFLKILNG